MLLKDVAYNLGGLVVVHSAPSRGSCDQCSPLMDPKAGMGAEFNAALWSRCPSSRLTSLASPLPWTMISGLTSTTGVSNYHRSEPTSPFSLDLLRSFDKYGEFQSLCDTRLRRVKFRTVTRVKCRTVTQGYNLNCFQSRQDKFTRH